MVYGFEFKNTHMFLLRGRSTIISRYISRPHSSGKLNNLLKLIDWVEDKIFQFSKYCTLLSDMKSHMFQN